jgi:hypothetical protein
MVLCQLHCVCQLVTPCVEPLAVSQSEDISAIVASLPLLQGWADVLRLYTSETKVVSLLLSLRQAPRGALLLPSEEFWTDQSEETMASRASLVDAVMAAVAAAAAKFDKHSIDSMRLMRAVACVLPSTLRSSIADSIPEDLVGLAAPLGIGDVELDAAWAILKHTRPAIARHCDAIPPLPPEKFWRDHSSTLKV